MSRDGLKIIVKSGTYGVMHICGAITVAYVMTGNLNVALGIGLVEPIVQVFVFALHESLWEQKSFWQSVRGAIKIGKNEKGEA